MLLSKKQENLHKRSKCVSYEVPKAISLPIWIGTSKPTNMEFEVTQKITVRITKLAFYYNTANCYLYRT